MGKLSRTKGHSFERQIAVEFQEIGFKDARRQLEYHIKDANGVDLQGTSPFAVQCKRGRTYAPVTAIEEIRSEGDYWMSGRPETKVWEKTPILITKADNKPIMAVLPWYELKKMIDQIYNKQ